MSDLEIEPYAVQQQWRMREPLAGSEWEALLGSYLVELAHACVSNGAGDGQIVVIGHIKLLALFSNGYLRVSVVSASHPPTFDGRVPDGLDHLSLTLNVLVYGLARDALQTLAGDIALALAAGRGGRVIAAEGEHPHHHHAG